MKTCPLNEKEIKVLSEQKKKEIRGGRKKKHLSTLNSKVKKAKRCLSSNKQENRYSRYVTMSKISDEKRIIIRDLFNKFSKELKELKREKRTELVFKKEEELKLLEEKQEIVQNILNNRKKKVYDYISDKNRGYKMKERLSLGTVAGMRSLEKDLNIKNIEKWINKEDM